MKLTHKIYTSAMSKSVLVGFLRVISGSWFHIYIVLILYVPINERDVHAKGRANIGGSTR